jgi:hypothetical protein
MEVKQRGKELKDTNYWEKLRKEGSQGKERGGRKRRK